MKKKLFLLLTVTLLCINSLSSKTIKGLSSDVYFIIGDNVNLRDGSSQNSKLIMKLKAATKIKIVKKENERITIGNASGQWVFVETEYHKPDNDEAIKGWVFDYYIGNITDFKEVDSFYDCSIDGNVGDWVLSFQFYKNGTFQRKILKNNKYIYRKGRLYSYRNVYYAYDEESDGGEFFYLNSDGYLCYKVSKMDGRENCGKCVH